MEIINLEQEMRIKVERTPEDATIIDTGIHTAGGYAVGRYVTEICMGGLGEAQLIAYPYLDLKLPAVEVSTAFPGKALFGAQFAGWQIKKGKYFAMGSGPARALALKPKDLYEKIEYSDSSEVAVIVLETTEKPGRDVLEYLATECKVNISELYVLLTPTSSLAGSTQISGRIVETGLHKLTEVGFDPKQVVSGYGYAPIAPSHPKFTTAMGRTNDMLLYGGVTYYTVMCEDDEELAAIVQKVPSDVSKDYGRPFADVFKSAGYDFYKIDPGLFAPAVIVVNNATTGRVHEAGRLNFEVIKRSLGLNHQ
jgi:methenyltetrahydromethanopterin cyclohydrolase